MANNYELLGIALNATPQAIEKAYANMLAEAGGKIDDVGIIQAYHVLCDPTTRASYNKQLIGDLTAEMEATRISILNLSEQELTAIRALQAQYDSDKSKLTVDEIQQLRAYLEKVNQFCGNGIPYLRQMIELASGDEKDRLEKQNDNIGHVHVKALKDLSDLERLAQTQEQIPTQQTQPHKQPTSAPPDLAPPQFDAPSPPASERAPTEQVPSRPTASEQTQTEPAPPRANRDTAIPAKAAKPKPATKQAAPQKPAPKKPENEPSTKPAQIKSTAPSKPAPLPPEKAPQAQRPTPPPRKTDAAPPAKPPGMKASTSAGQKRVMTPPPKVMAPPSISQKNAAEVATLAPTHKELDQTPTGRKQIKAQKLMQRFDGCKNKKSKRAISHFDRAVKRYNAAATDIHQLEYPNLKAAFNNRQEKIKEMLDAGYKQIDIQPATHFYQTSVGDALRAARDMKEKGDRSTDPLDKANYYLTAAELVQTAIQKADRKFTSGNVKFSKDVATKGLTARMAQDIDIKMQQAMQKLDASGPLLAKSKKSISLRDNPAFEDLAKVRLYTNKAKKADKNPTERAQYTQLANEHMIKARNIIINMPQSVARNNAEAVCHRYNYRIERLTTYTKTALTIRERFFEPASKDALNAKHALMDAMREIKKGEEGKRFSREDVTKYLAKAQQCLENTKNLPKKGNSMDEFITSMQRKHKELDDRLSNISQEVRRSRPRR